MYFTKAVIKALNVTVSVIVLATVAEEEEDELT